MRSTHLLTGFIFFILLSIVISSCTKSAVSSNQIPTATNNWQCQVDGVSYTGTIDTSVSRISSAGNDTTVFFTGTSADKKNSVLFTVTINRTATPTGILSSSFSISFLYVDSTSAYYLTSPYSSTSALLFKINSFTASELQGTFSGTINSPDGVAHTITSGNISCMIGQGDNEPKFFSIKDTTNTLTGYVDYARFSANSLIINGTSLSGDAQKFKLTVHTGSAIKTGAYKSTNGDVGLQLSQSGQFIDYVNDSVGNVTVNINSVEGNIITGTFSGAVINGKFSCKVTNYKPATDSTNKWSFSEDDPMFNYNIYGGNTLNTSFYQVGPKSYFILNGESDNGTSVFKIQISDYHDIATVLYQSGYVYTAHVDSMYFSSAAQTVTDVSTYIYMYDNDIGYCNIDTLDDHHIVGSLYGKIEISLGSNGFTTASLQTGSFRASF